LLINLFNGNKEQQLTHVVRYQGGPCIEMVDKATYLVEGGPVLHSESKMEKPPVKIAAKNKIFPAFYQ
jgi:hypothetical protein